MSVKIAKATPFEGKPKIMMPSVYGFSTGKEMFYTVPVIGKRPIHISVRNLPDGLCFTDGKFSGKIDADVEYSVTVIAENELGRAEKEVRLSVAPDNLLRTPLMGFTTWNAYESAVSAEKVLRAAHLMRDLGIAEYGYGYINLDSGWQKEYGGKYDAVMPNEKFPDMKAMYDEIHSLGFHGGIYSTPMLTAWGCPREYGSVPGCTVGEPDILYTMQNGGIGVVRKEENNVRQWVEWGVDYLKYDWTPTDPHNAEFMKKELRAAERDIAFCATVSASDAYGRYWQKNCSSWRDNCDSVPYFSNIRNRFDTVDKWENFVCAGHFYDLDMLAIGRQDLFSELPSLSENEELAEYTMTAFFSSPIQLSCHLDKLTEFEFDMICNDEIIEINQDSLASYPKLQKTYGQRDTVIYRRELCNGDFAVAVFNMGDTAFSDTYELGGMYRVRDVWAKENIGTADRLEIELMPHSAAVYRMSEDK